MSELVINRTTDETGSQIQNGFALLELARGWLQQANSVVAEELLKSAINSGEAEKDPELRARILKETARSKMMQSDWDEADSLYLEAQRLFSDIQVFKGAAECARNRANLYFQKGMYRHAEKYCEQALNWATEANDHELRASILNTVGAIKSATGDLNEAIKMFNLCLSDFQTAGNYSRQGYVILNIGLTQIELKAYDQAIQKLNEALSIAFSVKDLHLVEICYQNISKCYLEQNEVSLAKSVVDTARKFLPGLNSQALEAELNLTDCKILRMLGHFEAAEELLSETLELAKSRNLSALIADLLFEQGLLLKDQGKFDIARAKLEAASGQFEKLGMLKNCKDVANELNQLERTRGALQTTAG